MLAAGIFLESTSLMDDPHFEKVILFISAYDAAGATGFVTNKPFGRSLNELEEFSHVADFPLYEGGPVETEKLYFIHRRPDIVEDGININNGLYSGGDFKQVIEHINDGSLTTGDLKIFIGYCGWDGGQLEQEIEEGSWVIQEDYLSVF